ncbi:MAG: GNAT family N-acetyltransferase [Gammaproteobacteria bacterium]|nr:GNAT family N-acetyltransferase [Gammaproteobacteria bacterium]
MIVGDRVSLRAIEMDDLGLLVKWRNDPHVAEHFYEKEPLSLEMQKRWFDGFLSRGSKEKYFIIEDNKDGRPVGTISVYSIDWRSRHAEFGRFFLADESTRGKGYGKEALGLLLDFCFGQLNLNKIYGDTQFDNKAAIGLYESMGFVREGMKRSHVFRKGEYIDIVALSILTSEWRVKNRT